MDLTLDQLRVFAAVAETGSFSAAARRLRRVQSAVSYAVAQLEQQLGVAVFDRSGRVPVLTDAGAGLLAEAREVLRRIDDLRVRAEAFAGGVEPRVAIAVDSMFPMPVLIEAVRAFRREQATCSLALHSESLGGVAQLVLDGVCRVGIGGPLERFPAELEREAIGSFPMVSVASADHPLAIRASTAPIPDRELREHVQIVLTDRSALTHGIDRGVISDRTFRVADLATKLALIEGGIGWGGMPLHVVASALREGRLVRVLPASHDERPLRYSLFAITHRAHAVGPATRWLIERVREGLAARDALEHADTADPPRAAPAPVRSTRGGPARKGARRRPRSR